MVFGYITDCMVFALKKTSTKALQNEKKPFPLFQFISRSISHIKHPGTKPEKP